jgi:hypothetical protein
MYRFIPLRSLLPLALAVSLALAACDSSSDDGTDATDEPLQVQTVTDLPADPPTGANTGRPTSTGRYTLFSLRTGEVVVASGDDVRADSASTDWDIGFQSTNVIINGGTSGPGDGGALVVEDTFESVTEAPADDQFRVDGSATCGDDATARAICPVSESDNGWHTYNRQTNVVTPTPGRTLVVRTADGEGYAKIRILSYYEGNPADPSQAPLEDARYYTFEYVVQTDGSRDLSAAATE